MNRPLKITGQRRGGPRVKGLNQLQISRHAGNDGVTRAAAAALRKPPPPGAGEPVETRQRRRAAERAGRA